MLELRAEISAAEAPVQDSLTGMDWLRSKQRPGGSLTFSLAVHGVVLLVMALIARRAGHLDQMMIIDSGFRESERLSQSAPEMLIPGDQSEEPADFTELAVTSLTLAAAPVRFELPISQVDSVSAAAAGGGTDGGGFFGVPLKENSIVFVLDRSGSMQGARIQRVHYELQTAINGLGSDQLFNVLLYNSHVAFALPASLRGLLPASVTNRKTALAAAMAFPATGGTNGVLAIQEALKLRPDAVVFLTDGEFDIHVESDVFEENPQRTKIHTISIGDGTSLEILRRIARGSAGRFQHVQVEEFQNANRSVVSTADRRDAERLLRLAKGLERRRKVDRARTCCHEILRRYPQLPEVSQARLMLQRIRASGNRVPPR